MYASAWLRYWQDLVSPTFFISLKPLNRKQMNNNCVGINLQKQKNDGNNKSQNFFLQMVANAG